MSIDALMAYYVRMKTIIYGIRNCDTMKKARTWLETHGVQHEFHDYKISGVERAKLQEWIGKVGWETLLNRAGTTFRKLPETRKTDLSQAKAIELMLEAPSMIKRPVLEHGKEVIVGFNADKYSELKR